jgi:hypothetical protein
VSARHNDGVEDPRERRRAWGLALGWVVAAALAITVGVVAVTTVGASLRGRGPLGSEAVDTAGSTSGTTPGDTAPAEVDPDAQRVVRTIVEEFGEFDVACQGLYAIGLDARPDEAAGWRVVSYEAEPDDDVDAVFANEGRSIEIEVYCNRGEPTVGDFERNTLPETP